MLGRLTRSRSQRGGGSVGSGIGGGAAAGGGGGGHAGAAEARPHGPIPPAASEPGLVSGPTLQNSTVLGLVENAPVPSNLPTADGRNPYLRRPLPPPPQAKDKTPLATMPARPGTSLEGQTAPRPNFNKRMSRDDMFLNQPPRRQEFGDKRMSRDDMFLDLKTARVARRGFPMPVPPAPAPTRRAQSPTPEPSPERNVPTFSSVLVPPARMATPESTSGEIPIGMTVLTPVPSPNDSVPMAWAPKAAAMLGTQPSAASDITSASQPSVQRTKHGRRKLFGLFGKKHHEPEPVRRYHPPLEGTTYKDLEEANAAWMAAVTPIRSPARSPLRSHTVTDRPAPRNIPKRTNTTPASPPPVREAIRGRLQFLRSKQSEPSMQFRQDTTHFNVPVPTMTYLDVEIPDIKMERYSVMFGGLLGPQQQQQSPSALLARRQATLDKLKTVNDETARAEAQLKTTLQRRATSPHVTRSPTFSLFPTTPATRKVESPVAVEPMPSPRFRANTSPAVLPSPVEQTFEREHMRADHGQADRTQANEASVNPLQSNPAMMRANQLRPTREVPAAKPPPVQFEPTQSTLLLDSPSSVEDDDSNSKVSQPSLKANAVEPQWQMISPVPSSAPSSGPSSSASSTRKRSPSSVSSVMTHVTKPSIDEPDTKFKSAVEISIARQISISRQQRQLLLRPVKTKVPQDINEASPQPSSTTQQAAAPAPAPAKAPAQAQAPTGKPVRPSGIPAPLRTMPNPAQRKLARVEKLQETKMATPTLVRAERAMGQHNRRSERAIVEAI